MDHTRRIERLKRALEHAGRFRSEILLMGPPKSQAGSFYAWHYDQLYDSSKQNLARLTDELEYLEATTNPDTLGGTRAQADPDVDDQGED